MASETEGDNPVNLHIGFQWNFDCFHRRRIYFAIQRRSSFVGVIATFFFFSGTFFWLRSLVFVHLVHDGRKLKTKERGEVRSMITRYR